MSVSSSNIKTTLRTVKIEDAEAVLDIWQAVIAEGDYFISVSEEFNKTVEEQREAIEGILENERETMIVAEHDGKVVGWLLFQGQKRKRLSHTGSFGVMINQDFRGMGIGRKLITALLDWAVKNPHIEKVSLGAFSTNHRAIALYKSLGFVEEGRKVKEFKMSDNEYVDDILMYKLV